MNEEVQAIGVGPYPEPWPVGDQYDTSLLENGDKRNVIDKYRYWTVEAIKADLDTKRISLHVAIENWQHDLNIGTIVRTANAFNVDTVYVIGKRHWNRRGAMVTDRYMHIEHHDSVAEFVDAMHQAEREIIAIDIVADAQPLSSADLPLKCVFVYGGEGPGISRDMLKAATKVLMIEQSGSTRSVNVGVAAGISMYMWTRQHALTHHI